MSETVDLKCACVNCGGRIAFPPSAAGGTINCPHCSKPTVLQAPAPAAEASLKCPCQHCGGRIAFPPHAVGATIKCPHCAKDTVLTAPGVPVAAVAAPAAVPSAAPGPKPMAVAAPYTPTPPPPPAARKPISLSKPAGPAAAPHGAPPPPAAAPAAPARPGVPPPSAPAPVAAPVAGEAPAEGKKTKEKPQFTNCLACGTEMSIKAKQCPACGAPVPQSKKKMMLMGIVAAVLVLGLAGFFLLHKGGGKGGMSLSLGGKDDLQLVKYELTKIPGTTLMHVTGVVKNNTDHEVLSLQIDFKLFNKDGKPIGTASDFIMSLGPKTEWPFKAQVLDTDAVKAELVKINYQGK